MRHVQAASRGLLNFYLQTSKCIYVSPGLHGSYTPTGKGFPTSAASEGITESKKMQEQYLVDNRVSEVQTGHRVMHAGDTLCRISNQTAVE